jgi:hypothetical protein
MESGELMEFAEFQESYFWIFWILENFESTKYNFLDISVMWGI